MNDSFGSSDHAKTNAEEASPDSCCHHGLQGLAGTGEKVLLGGGAGAALSGWAGPSSAVSSRIQNISRTRLYFLGTDNCLNLS